MMSEVAGTTTESALPPARHSLLLTFLIADIRGYTAFTNEQGDEAAARLADRFAALCQTVIEAHGGEVVELRGDEALCVFSSARNALRGAVALQQAFHESVWTDPSLPLKVGMGIDVGKAIPVRGGYRGGALNLAARLCSIARAGEILATETATSLARRTEGLAFVDRGQVTLKGLARPVRVLQIGPEGTLPDELPPLQSVLATHPANLPDEPTPFIGRESEIEAVTRMLRDPHVRLVTLTGPGGTGKTRLALQVGTRLLYDFPDGVFFCDLSSLTESTLVPAALAEVLEINEERGKDLAQTLTEHLETQHLLVILDNFEHVLDAAPLVAALLDQCRTLHLLVTSRVPLHLQREHEYPVPPLAVPDPSHLPDLASLSQYESVALFIERAGAVKPGFTVTTENAAAVAEICSRLDGLPLAIELAAARIKLFSPQALLQRLDNRLTLLTGGARDLPERQRALSSTIDWSYSLLSPDEQTLFARLGVFAGGWTFAAAEAVCNPNGDLDVFEGLASLVDKSLIRQAGEEEPRFSLLETMRDYAAERLEARDDRDAVGLRHARYYAAMMDEAAADLVEGKQADWNHRLDAEQDNLRAAMAWTRDQDITELGLRMAGPLGSWWVDWARLTEGRQWLESLLATGGAVTPRTRAVALLWLGALAGRQGDLDAAASSLQESVALAEEAGDLLTGVRATAALGGIRLWEGAFDEGIRLLEQALARARLLGHQPTSAGALASLSYTLVVTGHLERGIALAEEALVFFRASNQAASIGSLLDTLARGKLSLGDIEGAESAWREGLRLVHDHGPTFRFPLYLEGLAGVAGHQGNPRRAARLFAAAEEQRNRTGVPLLPGVSGPRDQDLAVARQQIDDAAWDEAWSEGSAMNLGQAVTYALEEPG